MTEDPLKGEQGAVERTDRPVTVERLTADLRDLGVRGETVLVHSSLSALGWVPGGAPAVVDALLDAVTSDGTLVMPTHSSQLSDPGHWSNPPVPEAWHEEIREAMPPYRPEITPTRGIGAIPECFRNYSGVRRSRHPIDSFAASGADADAIVADHEYAGGLGEGSPLARVYDHGGFVLLLGTDHDTNTSLHLAEYRADYPKTMVTQGGPVLADGERRWVGYEEVEGDTEDFRELGQAFERKHPDAVTTGRVGQAEARLVSQPALVDFAAEWMTENRTGE